MSFVNLICVISIINVNITNMIMNYIFSFLVKYITKICINQLLNEKIFNRSLMFLENILTKLVDVDYQSNSLLFLLFLKLLLILLFLSFASINLIFDKAHIIEQNLIKKLNASICERVTHDVDESMLNRMHCSRKCVFERVETNNKTLKALRKMIDLYAKISDIFKLFLAKFLQFD